MQEEDIQITAADGTTLAATLFSPAIPPRGGVAICGALGVPRRFYARYASWLAEQGYTALAFDYRGTGDSPARGQAGSAISLEDWGRLDVDAVLADLMGRQGDQPVYLVGHSCGGQLIGFAAHSEQLAGAVLVAATAPNWKRYPLPGRLTLFAVWHLMVPALSFNRDVFPARRLGMSSIDVPAGVMSQWARWARSPDYLFSAEHGIDTSRYARLDMPILSLGFDDDGYASRAAIEALLAHYPAARIDSRHVAVAPLGVGRLEHFGYFKEKVRDSLWRDTLEWLERSGPVAAAA